MAKGGGAKKTKRINLKRWGVFLGLFFLCFFVGKVILSYRKAIWKEGRFNFVSASKPVLVFSLCPEDKSLTVVYIPQNTYLEVTRGFGLYRAESIYPLGETEGRGGKLLMEATQEFLGVPVEGWIKMNSKLKTSDKEEFIDLKRKITSWGVFWRPRKLIQFLSTNLTFWDLVKIWVNAKKVTPGRIKWIDLEKGGTLAGFNLADGSKGKKGNPILIDNLLKESFFLPEVRKETISVEVFNGTDHPGLANRAARIITNIGGKVVRTADSDQKIKRCQINVNDQTLKSFTFQKIQKIFDCQVFEWEEERINLLVGQDYLKKLFSK